ncbi:helix-turn-helix domain-containing protein [Nocardia suismassiliense]|uniref:Helix-turn-helix domain-containing protein n=1 Tax=Nocardia suismassiliense TaxID=2077092 RepID=A0ABW6QSR2_9NOCA
MSRDPTLLPDKPWRKPGIPTLGNTCRHFREYRHRGLSRETVCKRLGISTGYLFRIEMQGHMPSMEVIDQLIAGYHLDRAQARHLRDLRSPALDLEPIHELRHRVTTNAAQMAHLRDLESRGVLGAYVDPMASILACNNLFRTAMPGIEEAGSYAVWLFSPVAKEVFAEWDREADHCVAAAKGILGCYRDAPQTQDMLRRLRNNKDFRRRWAASIHISYGRATNDLMLLSEPARKEVTAYNFSHSHESRSVMLYVGFPKDDAPPHL